MTTTQADLFEAEKPKEDRGEPHADSFGQYFALAARRRMPSLDADLRVVEIDGTGRFTQDVRVVFGRHVGVFSRGPRKGEPKWNRRDEWVSVGVTMDEVESERLRYEADSGKCYVCRGCGRECVGWSIHDGVKMGPCERCKSSGVAPKGGA